MDSKLERLLEETVTYSTVTELREALLGIIQKFEKDSLRRYIVTRHGKPLAVLMGFPTYEAYQAIAKAAWDQEQAKDRETAVRDAIARMRADHAIAVTEDQPLRVRAGSLVGVDTFMFENRESHDDLKSAFQDLKEDLRRLERAMNRQSERAEEEATGPALAETE